jgi:hypothetical protein
MLRLLAPAFTLALLAAPSPSPAAVPAGLSQVALRLEAGSVAREQLVAIGRDLVVAGQALSDVAALNGSVEVTGQVGGDVIVLGGDVRLAASARVTGDVFVLGGSAAAAPGARVGGRLVSYPTASAAWLTLLEGPTLGLGAAAPVVLGAKLALLAAWSALLLVFFAASGREVISTADGVRREPFRSFFVGLTGVITLLLTGLFVSAFAGALVSLPLVVLLAVLALVLKLWGMVAVFHALGEWIGRRLLHRRLVPVHAATVGLLVLGVLKFLPWVGVWTWTVATLIGVGAALSTKFGRREPWFELGTA